MPADRRFYVYVLLDPRFKGRHNFARDLKFGYEPFYIGKGTGKRISTHQYQQLHEIGLFQREQEIRDAGYSPLRRKIATDLTEEEAFNLEARAIGDIGRLEKGTGPLVNQTEGNMARTDPPIKIFSGTYGLNASVEPARLFYDMETGIVDLTEAVNVDIPNANSIETRKGAKATDITSSCHSLWSKGADAFFRSGTSLFRLFSDFSSVAVVTGMSGTGRVAYEKINDEIYWMDGTQKGIIKGNTNSSWVAGTYYGPTTDREFSSPPVGTHIARHGSHMLVLQDEFMFFSRPTAYRMFDLAHDFYHLPAKGLFVRSVKNGLYVGTEEGVFFYQGRTMEDLDVFEVAIDRPVEWTDVHAQAQLVRCIQQETRNCVIWTGQEGIYVGDEFGSAKNVTAERITLPQAVEGSAVFHRGKYLCLLNP